MRRRRDGVCLGGVGRGVVACCRGGGGCRSWRPRARVSAELLGRLYPLFCYIHVSDSVCIQLFVAVIVCIQLVVVAIPIVASG